MPIASTSFIKGQIPGTTQAQLLSLYQREILFGGAGEAHIRDNTVTFSGCAANGSQQIGKFSNFDEGRLIINETDTSFLVSLEADNFEKIFLFSFFFTKLKEDLERELQANKKKR
ncbi:hypothetical protein [Chitinophaga nivalis]|uniref:Uncharacterized protein n=1 Tax=Chitinophaga nivalis TaxID=2991709 RepID=A0ABT3IH37_9BACT|nr:hypothetical protein [Chitinophaga nivalis]MCW3467039.1 hypothetical protein [Chitinophaga nivalis]MCW3483270.1 hypothetical protein [Chitinophaga nivalis]